MPDHDPDVLREQPCGGHSFHDDNGITGLDWSLSEVVFRQLPTDCFQNHCANLHKSAQPAALSGTSPVLLSSSTISGYRQKDLQPVKNKQ